MLNILKDTKVPNSDYVVAEDHLNVSEIDLVLCNNIYNSEIQVRFQAYYIANGMNFNE